MRAQSLLQPATVTALLVGIVIGTFMTRTVTEVSAQTAVLNPVPPFPSAYTAVPITDAGGAGQQYTKYVAVISPSGHVWVLKGVTADDVAKPYAFEIVKEIQLKDGGAGGKW